MHRLREPLQYRPRSRDAANFFTESHQFFRSRVGLAVVPAGEELERHRSVGLLDIAGEARVGVRRRGDDIEHRGKAQCLGRWHQNTKILEMRVAIAHHDAQRHLFEELVQVFGG